MQIRDEMPADAPAVEAVVRAAFAGMPYSDGSETRIVDALRRAGASAVTLVAVEGAGAGEAVVGHIMFSPVTIDGRSCGWHGLGPLAVRPDREHRGIGSTLVTEGLTRLRGLGSGGCVVLGDTGYYGRFGFRHDQRLTAPGLPAEHFMVLPFAEDVPSGAVAYHPGFFVES